MVGETDGLEDNGMEQTQIVEKVLEKVSASQEASLQKISENMNAQMTRMFETFMLNMQQQQRN